MPAKPISINSDMGESFGIHTRTPGCLTRWASGAVR